MTLSDRSLGHRRDDQVTASGEMAGFVVWLAGQRVPLAQRRAVYQEVERFLAWQHSELAYDASTQRPAVWCYLLRRERDDDGGFSMPQVWGALELFLDYAERPRGG